MQPSCVRRTRLRPTCRGHDVARRTAMGAHSGQRISQSAVTRYEGRVGCSHGVGTDSHEHGLGCTASSATGSNHSMRTRRYSARSASVFFGRIGLPMRESVRQTHPDVTKTLGAGRRLRRSLTIALTAMTFIAVGFPALAQTVTIRATIESLSEKEIHLRLRSGGTLTLPRVDVIAGDLSTGPSTKHADSTNRPAPDASASGSIPTYDVRKQCSADWPTEPNALATCDKGQEEALAALRSRNMAGNERQAIRHHCAIQWPQNYRLRNACEEEAVRALRADRRVQ
jgi:hypothetical protein